MRRHLTAVSGRRIDHRISGGSATVNGGVRCPPRRRAGADRPPSTRTPKPAAPQPPPDAGMPGGTCPVSTRCVLGDERPGESASFRPRSAAMVADLPGVARSWPDAPPISARHRGAPSMILVSRRVLHRNPDPSHLLGGRLTLASLPSKSMSSSPRSTTETNGKQQNGHGGGRGHPTERGGSTSVNAQAQACCTATTPGRRDFWRELPCVSPRMVGDDHSPRNTVTVADLPRVSQ
jgi:hypothetical protein